jgi:hypothetical protein
VVSTLKQQWALSQTSIRLKPVELDRIFYFGLKPFYFFHAHHALKGVANGIEPPRKIPRTLRREENEIIGNR